MDSSRRRSQPCSSGFFLMRHSALLYERRPRFLPFFFSRLPSVPLRRRGCTKPPLLKAPSHCKRMSLSHRKQSAFIMSYLPGPPWQQS